MQNAAGQIRCFEHWHICLPHIPSLHQSKQKSQLLSRDYRSGIRGLTKLEQIELNKLIRHGI
jgi:hypothetical protein